MASNSARQGTTRARWIIAAFLPNRLLTPGKLAVKAVPTVLRPWPRRLWSPRGRPDRAGSGSGNTAERTGGATALRCSGAGEGRGGGGLGGEAVVGPPPPRRGPDAPR